ncbi:MAG TPA: GAF domain-containing protein [Anaerolineales bacterium]|nr:GAF domain-containing protein [Anaerolineales bacterium]
MKILYVEDEIAHVELAQRTLDDNLRDTFVLYHRDSLRGALELLETEPDIDLVLTDLRLPDGSGLDLLKRIRERRSPPAVVLVTGQGDQEIAVAALKAGAADYLVKQSDYLHRLPVVISNAIAQNRLLREQAALRQAEIKYQSLVEQTPAVVFLDAADEAETTLYISPRVEELTGYTPDEWRADRDLWIQSIHPEDRDRIAERDENTHRNGERFQEEYRFFRRDGRVIWIKEDTNLIRDKDGNPLYWQGLLLDITKEKENESALQRQVEELAVLHAASLAASTALDVDDLISRVTNVIGDTLYPNNCGILLLDKATNALIPHPSYRGTSDLNLSKPLPVSQGITGEVARTGRPARVGDVTKHPSYFEVTAGIQAELCVPIITRGQCVGVINTESSALNAYSEKDEQLLVTIANTLATAIDKLASFAEEQQRARELATLYQATRSLTNSLEPEIIAQNLITVMEDLLHYEYAVIHLLDDQTRSLTPVALSSKAQSLDSYEKEMRYLQTSRLALGQGIIGWVAQHGEPIRSGDVSKEPRYLPAIKDIRSELCVPLIARGKVSGAINIETTQPEAYTERDENLLTALANSAAIALENARLYKSEQKRRQEAETLRQAAAAISSTLDLNRVMDDILKALKQVIHYNSASVFLHEGDWLRLAICQGFAQPENLLNLKFPANDELFQQIKETRWPVIIEDVWKDPRFKNWGDTRQVRGWMATPLLTHGEVIGYITLDSFEVGAYNDSICDTAMALANQAAAAIENARLFQEQSRRARIIEALADIANEIATTRDVFRALDQIGQRALDLLNANLVSIYLLEDDNVTLKTVTAHGAYRRELLSHTRKVGEGITGNVFLKGKPEIINSTKEDPRRVVVPGTLEQEEKHESLMSAPLILRGKSIGVINAWRPKENGLFNESELNFLVSIAHQASICIESGRLFQETRRQAQEAAAIAEVGRDISATLQLNIVLERIASYAMDLLHAETSAVYLADTPTSMLRAIAALGLDAEKIKNYPLALGTGILGNIALQSVGEIVNEVSNDPKALTVEGTIQNPHEHIMGVPILLKEQHTGLLAIWRSGAGAEFLSRELDFLTSLARQAAVAIENARLYDETQRRLRELETINRVSMSLRVTYSLTEMLPILLNETLELVNTPHGSIWLYDQAGDRLVQKIATGAESKLRHTSLRPFEGIVGHTFTTGQRYISAELKKDPLLFEGNREGLTPGLGGVCIPIQSTAGPVGVLMVAIESGRQISEELNLLTILAEITGNAIHRAELYQQSQEQVRRLTTLRDIDAAITSSFDLRLTLNILMDHTLNHLAVDAVDIALYHPELQSLTYMTGGGFRTPSPTRPQLRIGEGLAGQVIIRQHVYQVSDLQSSPEIRNEPLIRQEGFVSYVGVPLIVKGQMKGVFEVFHRSPLFPTTEWMEFLHTLAGQAAIAIDNAQLFESLQYSNQELMQAYDTTLEGWARALELRDRETEGHTRRVTDLTLSLARYIGIRESDFVNIRRGVLLHDIGKMGVPDHILKKSGPLTEAEWDEMRQHPVYAYNLLSPITYLRGALDIPYYHHEHWDGSGYPRGLRGEQIPLAARIFAVVDVWDALTHDRPYRKAWSREKAIEYLKEVSGKHLDSQIVEVFLRMSVEDESKTE